MNKHNSSEGATRRSFLHTILAAGMAPYILPSSVFGQSRPAPSAQLNVACIGVGGIMRSVDIPALAAIPEVNLVALCDVDKNMLAAARNPKNASKGVDVQARLARAKDYTDYRRLLEVEKSLDAVIIATPDHWHAPIATAAIQAGKHVYCEKPLTHTIGEARRLRELARNSKVVTQMGNQGSASPNLRRNLEVIQAGVLGQVREVHVWHPQYSSKACGSDRLPGEDKVPNTFDWDFWVGPAPMRPFLRGQYHPFAWRFWYDFGNGSLGDFCGHSFNLPVRALRLDHPTSIEVSGEALAKESYVKKCHLTYHFPARGDLAPVALHFHHGEPPPPEVVEGFEDTFGKVAEVGCVLLGDHGTISAGLWNTDGYLRMKGEKKFRGIANHDAAKPVPITLPRSHGHAKEWVDACRGNGSAFSNFDVGGLITEIGLTGALALRAGHKIEWDGKAMKALGDPEVNRFVDVEYRKKWLL